MARRALKPKAPGDYRYHTTMSERAVDQCETSEETGGLHRVEPQTWPPVKKRGQPTDDGVPLRCVYCGSHAIVYPDNDPDVSGVEIVTPQREKKPVPAGAKA